MSAASPAGSRGARPGYEPYEPQLQPVPFGPEIWTVEGPEVAYRFAGLSLACPTRTTVVRLTDGRLWLHSPVAYSSTLAEALHELGRPAFLVAPNTLHHLHLSEWTKAHPEAAVYASPDLARRGGAVFGCAIPLSRPPQDWDGVLDSVVVDLGSFIEVVFHHRPSRTLIVTDLMQTFEPQRVRGALQRTILRFGGAVGPNARASLEIRLAARGRRDRVRAALEIIRGWAPLRIVMVHGRPIVGDAAAELDRAFHWAGAPAGDERSKT